LPDFSSLDAKEEPQEDDSETQAVDLNEFDFVQNNEDQKTSIAEEKFKEEITMNTGWPVAAPKKEEAKPKSDNQDFFVEKLPEFTSLDEPEASAEVPPEEPVAKKKTRHGLLSRANSATKKIKVPSVKHHGLLEAAREAEKRVLPSIQEVETLGPQNSTAFSLTGLGKQPKQVVELKGEKDAIVEHDGVFVIQSGLSTSSVKQDPSFKKLVESVLR
jgi:hypothetical protein